jgi:hypothetical protein
VYSIPTLSIEVQDKSSQLPEDYIMLVNLPEHQDYKNLYLHVKLLVLKTLWEVYTPVSIKEEVKLSKKKLSKELLSVY